MHCAVAVDIDSCPDHVWAVLTDVTRWPQWTGAIRGAVLVGGGAVTVGSVVRLRAPRLPERTWQVTECRRQGSASRRAFALRGDGVGGHAVLRFRLIAGEPDPSRPGREPTTRLEVEHTREGWVGGTIARLTARTVEGHVATLADDLARHCASRRAACDGARPVHDGAAPVTDGGRDNARVPG
jgi:hypothetical protein